MFKKILVLSLAVLMLSGTAWAGLSYEDFKNYINSREVHTGAFFDIKDSIDGKSNAWGALVGTEIFDVWDGKVSVNGGYADSQKALGYANADLTALANKGLGLLPFNLPDLPVVDVTYSAGAGGGWDFADRDVAVGLTMIGVTLKQEEEEPVPPPTP